MNNYLVKYKNMDNDPGQVIVADYFSIQNKCIVFFLNSGEKLASYPAKLYYTIKMSTNDENKM